MYFDRLCNYCDFFIFFYFLCVFCILVLVGFIRCLVAGRTWVKGKETRNYDFLCVRNLEFCEKSN